MANIGKSISIKGDLTGNEDLVIEGRVEGGKIELPGNELTIGANGYVTAEIHAKSVIVIGKVGSSVSATEKIEIQSSGSVHGDVRAPRLIVQEGATLNGSVEMGKEAEKAGAGAGAATLLARTGTRLGD
jgi:cytoskeletal protein CcmA (bactofilin family)